MTKIYVIQYREFTKYILLTTRSIEYEKLRVLDAQKFRQTESHHEKLSD